MTLEHGPYIHVDCSRLGSREQRALGRTCGPDGGRHMHLLDLAADFGFWGIFIYIITSRRKGRRGFFQPDSYQVFEDQPTEMSG